VLAFIINAVTDTRMLEERPAAASIVFKRAARVPVGYLEKNEMDALLNAPDSTTRIGTRDHALLLFMYNSGARASEAAHLSVGDLRLHSPTEPTQSFVELHGKGNKVRFCPLWASTIRELKQLTLGRPDDQKVFLNRHGRPLTRFGIHDIVTRYARKLVSVNYPYRAMPPCDPNLSQPTSNHCSVRLTRSVRRRAATS
jgi:integrase/recombinase XerD